MKKLLSFMLAFVLIFTMLPFNAFAAGTQSEREEFLALACEAFPEYAEKIMSPLPTQTATTRSTVQDTGSTLVTSETRRLSDDKELTYTEYSDGVVYLTEVEEHYYKEVTTSNYESSAYAVHVTISIKGTSNINQSYFTLNNVSYSLFNGSYDEFTNTGTMSTIVYCSVCSGYPLIRLKETASQSALISYRMMWVPTYDTSTFYNSLLTIEIRNNNVTINHIKNT